MLWAGSSHPGLRLLLGLQKSRWRQSNLLPTGTVPWTLLKTHLIQPLPEVNCQLCKKRLFLNHLNDLPGCLWKLTQRSLCAWDKTVIERQTLSFGIKFLAAVIKAALNCSDYKRYIPLRRPYPPLFFFTSTHQPGKCREQQALFCMTKFPANFCPHVCIPPRISETTSQFSFPLLHRELRMATFPPSFTSPFKEACWDFKTR